MRQTNPFSDLDKRRNNLVPGQESGGYGKITQIDSSMPKKWPCHSLSLTKIYLQLEGLLRSRLNIKNQSLPRATHAR